MKDTAAYGPDMDALHYKTLRAQIKHKNAQKCHIDLAINSSFSNILDVNRAQRRTKCAPL